MVKFSSERLDRDALAAHQGARLAGLLATIHGRNAFYTRKLDEGGLRLDALRFPEDLARLPFTVKAELVADQEANPPWGTNLTEPLERLHPLLPDVVHHRRPLRWLDTNESWQWMLECWKDVYRAAQVVPGDRVFFPFSFGPFLGFWAGFEAGSQVGLHCVPGGGMSTHVRLTTIADDPADGGVLHADLRAAAGRDGRGQWPEGALAASSVRALIVSGEPGGNIPATRARIERSWGARVLDHHGLTEVGPISFECWESPGSLHLNEDAFICEVLDARDRRGRSRRHAGRAGGDQPGPAPPARPSGTVPATSWCGAPTPCAVRAHLRAAGRRHPARAATTW